MNTTTSGTNGVINTGDTAWTLASCILMMLMTPGVGLLYAGQVRQKNSLTILVQSLGIFSLTSIIWALFGFSLAFGPTSGNFIGDSTYFGFRDMRPAMFSQAPHIPGLLFFFYQLCACAVTPAIAVGSIAEKIAIGPSLLFVGVWIIVVYCPVAHWVWGYGWLYQLGAIDYAGGLVVHVCAGFTSLALTLVVGRRTQQIKGESFRPHNNTYVFIGTVLLWFGWFGFNGGSAYAATYQSVLAVVSTNISASTAAFSWVAVEYALTGRFNMMGLMLGSGCGLIAMTPGSGYCPVWASFIIGTIAGAISSLHSWARSKYNWYDDTTDVFSAHGVSGAWGVFATGLWASRDENDIDGGFYGRGILLGYQLAGIVTVAGYCFAISFGLAYLMKLAGWLRVSEDDESRGLDIMYGEHGYEIVPAVEAGSSSESQRAVGTQKLASEMNRLKAQLDKSDLRATASVSPNPVSPMAA